MSKIRGQLRKCSAVLITIFFLGSCSNDDDFVQDPLIASDFNAAVVTEWYDLIKTLTTETQGYTPPVAARAFGYSGIALYEAVQYGIPEKTSLSGKLTDLSIAPYIIENQNIYWPLVANTTLAAMTKYFYNNTSPERYELILQLEQRFNNEALSIISQEDFDASIALARYISTQVISYSLTDGGHNAQFNNFPLSYSPPVGPNFWKPTAPSFTPALQPYWGSNRPFLMANISSATLPVDPPVFSTDTNSVFYARAIEVYTVVNNASPEEIIIAKFWSDDPVTTATPPGHSISILNQLLRENEATLSDAAEAFGKLGIGVSDAFISCWKVKYETNYPRPLTYINEHIDPTWNTILETPPFPEYTSGHSVQSGALAEIMTHLYGENYQFTDRTHEDRTDIDGTPRNFTNFYEMAREAALSRLYGGIHYDEAIFVGLEQGYQIGRNINALNLNN
jgi:hypothetical protein